MTFAKRTHKRLWLTTTAIVGLSIANVSGATYAVAQSATSTPAANTLSVPAGPLESAILTLGRQANLRMLYPSAITKGETTAGVR